MSPDLVPIENIWQLLIMKLKRKFTNCQSLISAIKRKWKSLPWDMTTKLVRRMNNRISEVIKNDGDFILGR